MIGNCFLSREPINIRLRGSHDPGALVSRDPSTHSLSCQEVEECSSWGKEEEGKDEEKEEKEKEKEEEK